MEPWLNTSEENHSIFFLMMHWLPSAGACGQ